MNMLDVKVLCIVVAVIQKLEQYIHHTDRLSLWSYKASKTEKGGLTRCTVLQIFTMKEDLHASYHFLRF